MKKLFPVVTLVSAVALAGAANAAPLVIEDFVDVAATYKGNSYNSYGPNSHFQGRSDNGRKWGDSIGNGFDTETITLDRDLANSTLSITFRTDFDGTKSGADYADIFIDTNTPEAPDSFNYAISLGDQMSGGGIGNPASGGNNGGVAAGVYEVGTYKTANDVWGNSGSIYGGYLQFNDQADGFDPNFELEGATVLTSGNLLGGMLVSITQTAVSGGGFDLHVMIDGSANSALFNTIFDNFDILWGTGDCSNDAIWGMVNFQTNDVPAPGALALLGLGMLGLVLRRRVA